MFGLSPSTFYHPSFMYLPSQDMTKTHLLSNTSDGKRKHFAKSQPTNKKFSSNNCDRPVKKCSFDIESLLELKTKDAQISNRSYNEDTEDGSSDDGHTSYRSPPISSYALFNQLKTLDMTPHNNKSDPTLSSSSESDHSPYRLTSSKHLSSSRHGISHKIKPKRIRTIFTPEQLERLESEFDKQQYMVGNERFYLATTLDLTEAQVKVWFQNRRIKWRRQTLDDHQQRLTSITGQTPTTMADEHNHSDNDE
ncbi:unnamed protein product [Rotaria socialis]|uniref:Homeobox domain-containing protein n=1 Tax=Rotaria socialis TaxID=392032 RepID=A0A818H4N9_9BILA|nr:unnamed protein product [Rotaria socialis]CAF3411930.1 unnamed protein product [Rotaria socialis]CAF3430071.1 unnamed protein product [Rotaria socialis]CAF3502186.1 unnamed protein product [Rotaria socialis]CAF3715198.1 unnamed protein product [Rotaria socialis]